MILSQSKGYKPLISVLVPAFNHDRYIVCCLDSILNDNYPNKELIIINDGSTDNTHFKIARWVSTNKDKIYVEYYNRENRGVSFTLNELIHKSHGELLCPVASDDFLFPGGLETRVDYLLSNTNKYAVVGDCEVVDVNGNKKFSSIMTNLHKARKNKYFTDDGIKTEIITNFALGGPTLLIKRDTFDKIGFFNEDIRIEDWDLFLRLVSRNLLGFIDFPVAAYRLHETNTCRTKDVSLRIKNLSDQCSVAAKHLGSFDPKYRRMLLAEAYLLKAKIHFLDKSFLRSFLNLSTWFVKKFHLYVVVIQDLVHNKRNDSNA